MLDNFTGEGYCVVLDSAYMGEIMALIGCQKWKINMVGTAQDNRTDADTEAKKNGMKKNTYEAVIQGYGVFMILDVERGRALAQRE